MRFGRWVLRLGRPAAPRHFFPAALTPQELAIVAQAQRARDAPAGEPRGTADQPSATAPGVPSRAAATAGAAEAEQDKTVQVVEVEMTLEMDANDAQVRIHPHRVPVVRGLRARARVSLPL